ELALVRDDVRDLDGLHRLPALLGDALAAPAAPRRPLRSRLMDAARDPASSVKHVVILGAGFAGLELATRLSESLAGEVRTTLIDQDDAFSFGFSKLDIVFGRKPAADVLLHYEDISLQGVEFRQERVTSIDPARRR